MVPRYGSRQLSNGLEKEVYQIVRQLRDTQDQYSGEQPNRLSVTSVYDSIRRSNSSLGRKNKKLLENSIERALDVLQQEAGSSDSIDGEFDGDLAEDEPKVGT